MNNQFRKKEIIYDVFRESDLEQTIACITEVFPKREPMTRALRFTSEELYLFSEIYCKKAAKEGLSIVAKDRTTSKVIGFCISEDLASEPIEGIKKINVKSNPIMLNVQRPVGVKKGVYNIIALMKSRQKIVEFKYMYRY
jgi:hypothetical protein